MLLVTSPPRFTRRPGRAVRWLGFRAAAVALGLVIAVAMSEILLRIVPGLMPAHAANRARLFRDLGTVHTRPDPYIGFLYPPNFQATMRHYDATFTFRTDSRGFRNADPWPARADVVAVGDSLTFGFGVPDGHSWVDLAARTLPGAAVVNLALPGFGPLQQLRVYETFGAALRPKIVLVGFFPANDFWDTAKFLTWLGLGEGGNYLLWRDFGVNSMGSRSVIEKVLRASYLQSLLWAALNPGNEEFGRDGIVLETPKGRLRLLPSTLRKLRERASPGRPEFEEAFAALRELDDRVRAGGGRMVVVVLPSKEYVYLPLAGGSADDPLKHVHRALEQLNLSYLDVAPRFRERAAAGELLFFEIDGHPNEQGYAVIAEAVVDYLRSGAFAAAVRRDPRP
jgi:acetyltransferase AlgX (SGNH hydrolase-like protein)